MSIAASLNLTEATRRQWDVIAVGAGPAGSVAARQLALKGAQVLLVDKAVFPRAKVCGCCLNARALSTVTAVGLGDLVVRCGGVPLSRMKLASQGSQADFPVEGYALSREVFDAALIEAAIASGVHFLPATQARLGETCANARTLVFRHDGQETLASARMILGADGLGGRLLAGEADHRVVVEAGSRLGGGVIASEFPEFFAPGNIFMACGEGGYVGLVRIEDGRLNLAAAFDAAFVKQTGGLGKAAAVVLLASGFPPIRGLEGLAWHGTPLLTRRVSSPALERVFLLGDAAGYVEPFTGEGMAWALAGGVAAAPLVLRACRGWHPSLAGQWTRIYRETITRRQWVCRGVANVLRRPALVGLVVSALARFPILASPLVRYLNVSGKRAHGIE